MFSANINKEFVSQKNHCQNNLRMLDKTPFGGKTWEQHWNKTAADQSFAKMFCE